MAEYKLIPRCPECDIEIDPDEPGCDCIESRLPYMGFHNVATLARRIVYLEALVKLLVDAEERRKYAVRSRAAKRADKAKKRGDGT